jgi:holliday junction DNA helicase RuvA
MIASIHGEVIGLGDDSLVVAVGGIGVRVFVPSSFALQTRIGDSVFLNTVLIVREDSLSLYGFRTQDEESFFNLLLGVNGIGPRLALAVLSSLSVDAVRRAVLAEQPEVFTRVPGVGKKTGQKIILYLQGKVGEGGGVQGLPELDVDTEVLEALTSLGYSIVEAQAAIQSIPRDTPQDVESRLRAALRFFSG